MSLSSSCISRKRRSHYPKAMIERPSRIHSGVRPGFCVLLMALSLATAVMQTRFVDDAGREVQLPSRVDRIFAAGAPAEVLLYTLAPEMLAGRNRLPEGEAIEFF